MNRIMIQRLASRLLLLTGLLAASFGLQAETFTGKLNGHDCAERGTSCPVDRLDPHVILESDFVLQVASGDYYFLVNLPRDVKVRHVLEPVVVSGDVNRKYNAITVDTFTVNGKEVWSQAQAQAEYDRLFKGR